MLCCDVPWFPEEWHMVPPTTQRMRTMSRGGVEWPELGQAPGCSPPPPYMGGKTAPPACCDDAGAPNIIDSVAEPGCNTPSGCRSLCDGSVSWRLTC